MNYRFIIYVIITLLTAFTIAGVNFNNIFKKNHFIEAKISIILLIMCISYLCSEFIIKILEYSSIF